MATLFFSLLSTSEAICQQEDVMSLPGTIGNYYGKKGPPNMLNNDGLNGTVVNTMLTQLLNITVLLENCPDFRQPKGFDLRVQLSVNTAPAAQRSAGFTGDAWLAIHEFFRNPEGRIEANSETGAGIQARVNQLSHLFPDESNGECEEFNMARFFYQVKVKELGGNCLEMQDGTRVITNGNPLVVPYTNEQYLQFFIRRTEKVLSEQQASLQQFREMKEKAATAPDGHKVTSADKGNEKYGYLLAILEGVDRNISDMAAHVASSSGKLSGWKERLKGMTDAERQKQAHLYFNSSQDVARDEAGRPTDADKFLAPTTDDDPHGLALFTINPHYFNFALPKTSIQLISLTKDLDSRFVKNEYARILDRVMDCVDYAALKAMVKQ